MEFNPYLGDSEELFLRHKNFIHKTVNKYSNGTRFSSYGRDDLFSVATIGFLQSYERFSPEKATNELTTDENIQRSFLTYCGKVMEGQIKKFFRDKSRIIRPPRSVAIVQVFIKNASLMGEPPEVIHEKLNGKTYNDKPITLEMVKETIEYMEQHNVYSMDTPTNSTQGGDKETTIQDSIQFSEDDDFTAVYVNEFIESLPEREQIIVNMRMKGKTQREIADVIGTSQIHVSRLLSNKIEPKLTEYLGWAKSSEREPARKIKEQKKPMIKTIHKEEADMPTKSRTQRIKQFQHKKQEIIELLINTEMTAKDIAKKMDVSQSAVNKLSAEHRSPELREKLRQLGRLKGHEKMRLKNNQKENVIPAPTAFAEVAAAAEDFIEVGAAQAEPSSVMGKITRKASFSYEISGKDIMPKDFEEELYSLFQQIHDVSSTTVSFSLRVEAN